MSVRSQTSQIDTDHQNENSSHENALDDPADKLNCAVDLDVRGA
jgi:hypothetical protein